MLISNRTSIRITAHKFNFLPTALGAMFIIIGSKVTIETSEGFDWSIAAGSIRSRNSTQIIHYPLTINTKTER